VLVLQVTIYIPIIPIATGILVYLIVGVLLTIPFVLWERRFLTSSFKPSRPWHEGINWKWAFPRTALFWPLIVAVYTKTEIEYRKKGYL
jgi:hypothetical protein